MFDQYIESGKEIMEHLKNYRELAEKVKHIVMERCRDARVLVFGSVVEGKVTALSDIDILVICDLDREKIAELKSEIRKKLGYHTPIELHIVSDGEFQRWYKRFIGKFEEV
ncbi:MAG: nucleotidyltransferase domain-containing protein [Nitrososphaeria archaeon]|nr:nucleotidyltransferase domain-containing protein [Aigarchaeota archaeon]MCX8188055.1 nucleotidyltransferase domain-containing protein [Nitrososphaeria archaeon]